MSTVTIVEKIAGKRWEARFAFDYATKDVVKAAGFRFDGASKVWWTDKPEVAAKFADPDAARQMLAAKVEAIEASRATDAQIEIPVPAGLAYLPFQKAGIAYATKRTNVLIGDEMGLGKTIQAIGIANADPEARSVLVICPASLKLNWKREWEKWDVKALTVGIANGKLPEAQVVIINYDIIAKHRDALMARQWDLLIVDECHYPKTPRPSAPRRSWASARAPPPASPPGAGCS